MSSSSRIQGLFRRFVTEIHNYFISKRRLEREKGKEKKIKKKMYEVEEGG